MVAGVRGVRDYTIGRDEAADACPQVAGVVVVERRIGIFYLACEETVRSARTRIDPLVAKRPDDPVFRCLMIRNSGQLFSNSNITAQFEGSPQVNAI